MRLLLLQISFLLAASAVSAQRVCGSQEYLAKIGGTVLSKPVTTNNAVARDTIANEVITIPVVFHIIYNTADQNLSDQQILSQLRVLNEDFRRLNADASFTPEPFKPFAADCRISFCLAQTDPAGKPTSGIVRKNTTKTTFSLNDGMKFTAAGGDDAWDCKKYLNIWVCNMEGNTLGYATVPGGQADKDGVVIQYDAFGTIGNLRPAYNKGRSATHEVGHWLGLKHVWGDNDCGSDEVDDTPQQFSYNNNCPTFPHMSTCSPNSNGDMFMDYMDYTNDACMNMFTAGQRNKMRAQFALNGFRNSFLNSTACESAGPIPVDSASLPKPTPYVEVYPNPAKSDLNLKEINGYELVGKTLVILSTSGHVLVKKTIVNANDKISINNFQSGVYIMIIGDGADRIVKKIIKI